MSRSARLLLLIICLLRCLIKLLPPFQERMFKMSVYGILACFTSLNEVEPVLCTLKALISMLALEIAFSIHQDTASSYASLCDLM